MDPHLPPPVIAIGLVALAVITVYTVLGIGEIVFGLLSAMGVR